MLPHILDGVSPDLDPRGRSAGEGNAFDFRMFDQARTCRIPGPENQVNDTRRQADVLEDLGQN